MRWSIFGIVFVLLLCGIHLLRGGYIPASRLPIGQASLSRSHTVPVLSDWRIAALRTDKDACARFFENDADFQVEHAEDRPIRNGCGWNNALRVTQLSSELKPVTLSCPAAAASAQWMKHVVQPAAEELFGSRVKKLIHFGSYSCRNIRNGRKSHKRSEHATANAFDVAGFQLASGERISVLDHWNGADKKSKFLRKVHRGACRYFRVVLGPEANALHRNHFHFDRGWLFSCR